MQATDQGPVTVPRQVHCELRTLRQMGNHDLLSGDVLDVMEHYEFEAARTWALEHPDESVRAVVEGTRDRRVVGDSRE